MGEPLYHNPLIARARQDHLDSRGFGPLSKSFRASRDNLLRTYLKRNPHVPWKEVASAVHCHISVVEKAMKGFM